MRRILSYIVVALLAGTISWLIFGRSNTNKSTPVQTELPSSSAQIWTCSMHPQIKQDKPGTCPLCGMDLIPVKTTATAMPADSNTISMSEEAVALADVQTMKVNVNNNNTSGAVLHLYGTIQPDERAVQSQTAHVEGRIEKLMVDFTGETVTVGQTLATVYSPELINAQQELIEALKMSTPQPALVAAAKEKLKRWKLTEAQIQEIVNTKTVNPTIAIKSNTRGIVTSKKVNEGDYVKTGQLLFEVTNLSKVWAMLDAYEADLPFIHIGDEVQFTLKALPNEVYKGKVVFVDPILNKSTRTAQIRVEVNNTNGNLKPEMYISATIEGALKNKTKNEASKWPHQTITIPKSAVLWTGKRSIVYVKDANANMPTFKLREIELGSSLGDQYIVLSGLKEGEEVVVQGAFAIDASAQLEGKESMMNRSNN